VLDDMQQLLAASEGPLGALLALREQVSAQPQHQGFRGWVGFCCMDRCTRCSTNHLIVSQVCCLLTLLHTA